MNDEDRHYLTSIINEGIIDLEDLKGLTDEEIKILLDKIRNQKEHNETIN